MALPVLPIAIAAGAFALARNISITSRDQRHEDHLDNIVEGLGVSKPNKEQLNASYRHKSVVRLGTSGPAIELDLTMLSRIKLRRVQ